MLVGLKVWQTGILAKVRFKLNDSLLSVNSGSWRGKHRIPSIREAWGHLQIKSSQSVESPFGLGQRPRVGQFQAIQDLN